MGGIFDPYLVAVDARCDLGVEEEVAGRVGSVCAAAAAQQRRALVWRSSVHA